MDSSAFVRNYQARDVLPQRGHGLRRQAKPSNAWSSMAFGATPVWPWLQSKHASARARELLAARPAWYPYLMRRLAEPPANVLFVLPNLTRH
jgi:hypothetical protein